MYARLNRREIDDLLCRAGISYELQPPGLTALFLFESPPHGGDTLFVDQVKAYKRLSPSFREYLETLQVEHSGFEQAKRSAELHGADSIKRQPVRNIHPLVRRHPVTGEKALCVLVLRCVTLLGTDLSLCVRTATSTQASRAALSA